jgi:DinB family protein
MRKLVSLLAVCTACTVSILVAPAIARAQNYQYSTTNPVVSSATEIFERQSKWLMAGADEMPADKYNYKPTADQMTFGWIVQHVAAANFGGCSSMTDMPVPDGPKVTQMDPKDKLLPVLKASFDFCAKALASMTDAKLGEQTKFFGRAPVPRARMLIELTDDLEDHYSQMASYLRLNQLTPPSAQHH